jgi:hypothetical protein
MKVKILEGCQNWLVDIGKVYEVAQIEADGTVILKHPLENVKPTLLKGEYEIVNN